MISLTNEVLGRIDITAAVALVRLFGEVGSLAVVL
jgi:hypothetical protein